MRNNFLLLLLCSCSLSGCTPNSYDALGLLSIPPDSLPQIFAKDIISIKKIREGAITFSPDMKQIFFTRVDSSGHLRIMEMKYSHKSWTQPREWEHSDKTNNYEPFMAPDGDNLYFVSDRHAPNVKGSGRVWISSRVNAKWSTPEMLDLRVQTQKGLWFPTVSGKGTLFFGAYLDSIGNYGKSDLYMLQLNNNAATIKNLGNTINSAAEEWDPFIAPDESYLLFESDRPGGFGGTDIYITFNREGRWSLPVNLGSTINTKDYEVAARVSPDGKYIFFDRPQKNEQDIHWVSSDVIKRLESQTP